MNDKIISIKTQGRISVGGSSSGTESRKNLQSNSRLKELDWISLYKWIIIFISNTANYILI